MSEVASTTLAGTELDSAFGFPVLPKLSSLPRIRGKYRRRGVGILCDNVSVAANQDFIPENLGPLAEQAAFQQNPEFQTMAWYVLGQYESGSGHRIWRCSKVLLLFVALPTQYIQDDGDTPIVCR